jgi:hypothetical protein
MSEESRVNPGREKERVSALTAGLAATIVGWTFAAAFAPATLDNLGEYSPWLYGPVSTAAWAFFSLVAYLLIHKSESRHPAADPDASYRCREFRVPSPTSGFSVCANSDQKNHLAAVTAGFALTIASWVVLLSLMPDDWLDALSEAPAWSYCTASVTLWAALSITMYHVFSAAERRQYERET